MNLVSSKLTTLHVRPRMRHPQARASSARRARQQQITPAAHMSQQRTPSTVVHHTLRMQLQLVSRRASKLPMMLPSMPKTPPTVLVTRASKQLDLHSNTLRTLPTVPAEQASKQPDQHSSMPRRQPTAQAEQASKQLGLLSRLLMLPAGRASRHQGRHSRHTMMPQVLHQMQPQWASRRASRQQVVLLSMLTTPMSLPRTLQVGFLTAGLTNFKLCCFESLDVMHFASL